MATTTFVVEYRQNGTWHKWLTCESQDSADAEVKAIRLGTTYLARDAKAATVGLRIVREDTRVVRSTCWQSG